MANLTSRELTALQEQLNAENILISKYKDMANNCTDKELATTFEDIALKHQSHYNMLFQFLN